MRLIRTVIDSLTFDGATHQTKDIRWDERVPGFGMRLWPSGKKTFVLKYRFRHRQRYLTLGSFGPMTADQAYKMALQTHATILSGVDPLAERQKARRGETVADLCKTYIEKHAKPHNKTWEKDQERIDAFIIPAWGGLKVKSIKRSDVSALHHKIGVEKKKPTTANRVIALLSSMFNRARREYGFLEEWAPNPADGIERFPEKKRRRFVNKAEMPKLAQAIIAEPNIFAQAAIWAYLLTGLRKDELLTLKWMQDAGGGDNYVDLERQEVHLVDTKAGRDHTLPLSQAACQLFASLSRTRLALNPYVFCGAKLGHHLVNVSKPWGRIRTQAGLLDVRLHDLRRTVGSWLAMAGGSLPLIGEVLNHSNPSTTQVYARFHRDPVTDALNRYSRELDAATGGLLPSGTATLEPGNATAPAVEATSRVSR